MHGVAWLWGVNLRWACCVASLHLILVSWPPGTNPSTLPARPPPPSWLSGGMLGSAFILLISVLLASWVLHWKTLELLEAGVSAERAHPPLPHTADYGVQRPS